MVFVALKQFLTNFLQISYVPMLTICVTWVWEGNILIAIITVTDICMRQAVFERTVVTFSIIFISHH